MKISLQWLREYVDVELPLRDLLDRLTMIGLIAETWTDHPGGDVVLDVETYANRPDTLGHLGIAREVAVLLDRPLKEKPWPLAEGPEKTADLIEVEVPDGDLCPRYAGIVVRGVRIEPSPDWLRDRIEAMGGKSINTVVDVSNYVLFATGQPVHFFDLDKLNGRRIVVRRARKGEALRTLDGRDTPLSPDMLVIADAKRPAALAGVIGGEASGVGPGTKDIFIESAHFDPSSIRRTRRALGVMTDACYRFERGTDIGFAPEAARMAASLLGAFGGRASTGLVDIYPKPRKTKEVILRSRRAADLLGVAVPEDFIVKTLSGLGFGLKASSKGSWRVQVPTFRVDIEREADLIEEIARFFGYDRIPVVVPPFEVLEPAPSDRSRIDRLSGRLFHYGFDEVVNASFADPESEVRLKTGKAPVALRNPFSVHAAVLRTTLLGGLLENLQHNRRHGTESVHIFEIGRIFNREDGSAPVEKLALGLLSAGPLGPPHWREKAGDADIFHLKGALESALEALRYAPLAFGPAEHPAFEDGTAAALLFKGERLGGLGRVRETLLTGFDLAGPVFAAEIELEELLRKKPAAFAYEPPPRFPAVVRDLSFIIDRNLTWQEVEDAVARAAVPHLESFEVVDRYAGPSIPPDRASLSIRFVYRSPRATLQAEEAGKSEEKILKALKSAFGIQLREGGAA